MISIENLFIQAHRTHDQKPLFTVVILILKVIVIVCICLVFLSLWWFAVPLFSYELECE